MDTDFSIRGKSLARVMVARPESMVIVFEESVDELRSKIACLRLPGPVSLLLVTVKDPPQDNAEKAIVPV